MSILHEDFSHTMPLTWRARAFVQHLFSPSLWGRRLSFWLGAIVLGLFAAGFSRTADKMQALFLKVVALNSFLPLLITPAAFAVTVWATRRWFPSIPGSGIPQAIAAHKSKIEGERQWLLGPRVIFSKMVLTALGLLGGASIGREGPTVQMGAALLMLCSGQRSKKAERAFILAGAAAGVAAAFNTPLAGIVFAIEEMAQGFQRRSSEIIMIAIVLASASSMAILGDYTYFGHADARFALVSDALPLLITGVVGGFTGSLFAWALTRGKALFTIYTEGMPRKRPIAFAAACGFIVALLGVATHAATYGTGYALGRGILQGELITGWGCAMAKFLATVLSSISGLPGGLFSPSLAVGATLGSAIAPWFAHTSFQMVVLLSMTAYFAGVTQAPITSAIIVFEITGKTIMPAPLVAVAVLAAGVARLVSPMSLYHMLARDFAAEAGRRTVKAALQEENNALQNG